MGDSSRDGAKWRKDMILKDIEEVASAALREIARQGQPADDVKSAGSFSLRRKTAFPSRSR